MNLAVAGLAFSPGFLDGLPVHVLRVGSDGVKGCVVERVLLALWVCETRSIFPIIALGIC
jgi:hypothetical protein